MEIAIGSDHTGVQLKKEIIAHLAAGGYQAIDIGAYDDDPVDYPDIADKVAGDRKSVV